MSVPKRIGELPAHKIPTRWSKGALTSIWCNGMVRRNDIMHEDKTIDSPIDARRIVDGVEAFIRHNSPED